MQTAMRALHLLISLAENKLTNDGGDYSGLEALKRALEANGLSSGSLTQVPALFARPIPLIRMAITHTFFTHFSLMLSALITH